jgi:hypothetical protein
MYITYTYGAAGGNFLATSTKMISRNNFALVTLTQEGCRKLKEAFNKLEIMKTEGI